MDNPEDDPWNTPDVHAHHNHVATPKTNNYDHGHGRTDTRANGDDYGSLNEPEVHSRTTSNFTTASVPSASGSQSVGSASSAAGGWDYFGGATNNAAGFGDTSQNPITSPFGSGRGPQGDRDPGANPPTGHARTVSTSRTGNAIGENILVALMPEKEGMFMFQHHNYEVTSMRRGSKVIRRYSDFVWLLDCLHKRYPFRALPLLPPKRVAVNGNHLSNDGAFIEKRRRGLARFLNATVRHPILGQEQLVIMFLTVPTVCLENNKELRLFLHTRHFAPAWLLAHPRLTKCRSFPYGANRRRSRWSTSLPVGHFPRDSRTRSPRRSRTSLTVHDKASSGQPTCT